MNFKKALLATATAAAFTLAIGGANATLTTQANGPQLEFKFSGFTTENNTFAAPLPRETTWGVGNVTSVDDGNPNHNVLWASGFFGFAGYMIYGIADLSSVQLGPTEFNLYNYGSGSGGIFIDIYERTTPVSITDSNARCGFNCYTGVTDGAGTSLFLRLLLVPGIVLDDPATIGINEGTDATLFQHVSGLTLPATGNGEFYASVVGGSAAAKFDSNGFTTLLGTKADMKGGFHLQNNVACVPIGATEPINDTCFPGQTFDPIQAATVVPEPGTLALLGLAFAGLGLRRRKA